MISTPGTRFPRAVREPPRRSPAGSPLATLFPQESRALRLRNIVGSGGPSTFRQKEFRIALAPNQNFKRKLDYPSVFLKGWKICATLLPNNWLAETPQTLASRRLGRQSAERERISEINWNVLLKKLQAGLIRNMFKTSLSFKFFSVILIGWKRCATLLPNNWLAKTPQVLL
ncbi:hypothetical protein LJR015_000239 [Peribacillus frigoritolerans]|uniref:hypothetical protein n=1 Tax=Peribacillus frigoritolerans TaxID=450367 RepID=UPI003ECD206C